MDRRGEAAFERIGFGYIGYNFLDIRDKFSYPEPALKAGIEPFQRRNIQDG
jgi:hypothetical protein